MKKTRLAAVVALLYATSSFAQSSVTLFGVIDEGVAYVDNIKGSSITKTANGIRWPTYWGMKGREDLGGGWYAEFNLQSTFNINTGATPTSGVLFGRTAQVGIGNARYGQVSVGRQIDFMNDFLYLTSPQEEYLTTYSLAPASLDRLGGGQLNNTIKYRSGLGGGLTFGAMYALPNADSATSANGSGRSFEIRYIGDSLKALAVYTEVQNLSVTPASSMGSTSFLGYELAFGSSTAVQLRSLSVTAAGLSYTIDRLTGVFSYTNVHMNTGRASGSLQTVTLGAVYRFTPAFEFEGGAIASRLGSSRWNQLVGTLDYFLSKGTDIYVAGDWERVSGPGQFAELNASGGPSSTTSQAIVQVGIKHYF